MAFPRCSLLDKEAGDDHESDTASDQLLDYDYTSSEPRVKSRVVATVSLFRVYVVILHILLLALVSVQWNENRPTTSHLTVKTTWSPVQEFIKYEVRPAKAPGYGKDQKFAGPPTEEQDDAWDYIIDGSFFNATIDELEKAGEDLDDLAELTDGGYLASIGVYHELHCLRQLRLYVYRDIYYPNLTHRGDMYLQNHMDHCLEALRQTIVCYGNTALSSFHWERPDAPSPEPRSNARSVCAQWDSIENWAYTRKVSPDPDYKKSFGNQY
ncbi:hypothetical protein GGR54DRAFT_176530 [Hypoxylon sp. NC1633]|nr:hypothetical protein GGR54DRAFT_176530 [Hypoxylon sp. NC1633]